MTTFPSLSPVGERRQARLQDARLGVVVDAGRAPDDLAGHLAELFEASTDLVWLRDDTAEEDTLRTAADVFRRAADDAGALFIVDRLPGLTLQVGADGVNLAAVDADPDHARQVVGPDVLVGRALRAQMEILAAGDEDVDFLVVDARQPDGDDLVAASVRASHPWFVLIEEPSAAAGALELGARRIMLRQIPESADPSTTCWELRRALGAHPLH